MTMGPRINVHRICLQVYVCFDDYIFYQSRDELSRDIQELQVKIQARGKVAGQTVAKVSSTGRSHMLIGQPTVVLTVGNSDFLISHHGSTGGLQNQLTVNVDMYAQSHDTALICVRHNPQQTLTCAPGIPYNQFAGLIQLTSVAHAVVSKVEGSTVSSFVSEAMNKPLFSIANSNTKTSVANVSGQVNQITVTAEIHQPPRVAKPVVNGETK